ncbi:MAG: nuclease-related domain-containing protein [Bacillus sp. (in: firmicutes)]
MAQLVKLKDYISRYEQNIILYPSRFVRLKKQKWEGIKKAFEMGQHSPSFLEEEGLHEEEWLEEKSSFFTKLKGIMQKNKKDDELEAHLEIKKESIEIVEEDELAFDYKPNYYLTPKNIEELKVQFLNQLLQFQMKWASSTLTEKSVVKKAFYYDEVLKYYLQRFPDTYLVLYQPVFLLQNAPIELDTIIITPTEVWCITLLEAEESSVFVGSNEKFWTKKRKDKEKKILSPVISINRTEKVIKKIMKMHEIDFPIKKAILTRNGYIDYPMAPYDLKIIEKRNYEDWFQTMRNNRSPLKAIQLKTAESLLRHCLTTCMRRYEWDTKEE